VTAYEYLDVAQSNFSNAIAMVSLSIAVLSGYVIVAYTVGAKLSRVQVAVFNTNYVIWSLYLMASGGTALANGYARVSVAQEMLGDSLISVSYPIHIYGLIGFLLVTTSLWFMWSIRHPKTD
jgi:hypothetical protein